jgi:hypothetical protein
MASNAKLIKETLTWCNRIRAKNGKKPLLKLPKGSRDDPNSCPCGKACGFAVYPDGAYDEEALDEYSWIPPANILVAKTNRFVRQFIEKFDDGNIPEQDLNPIENLSHWDERYP